MATIVLFAALGLGSGALIASIALGVVLHYRGSGVINLSTGATAMLAGYLWWAMRTGFFGVALPTLPALAVTLVLVVLIGLLLEVAAFRPLQKASPLAKLVASLGLFLLLQSGILLIFGTSPLSAPAVLPSGSVTFLGISLSVAPFLLAAVVIVLVVLLSLVYRLSRFGLATRAASESEPYALLAGLSPQRLALANGALASLTAGLVGILAASVVGVNSSSLPLLIIPALAAALFARFTSFVIAGAAGLLIGMAESVLYYFSTQWWFPHLNGSPLPGVQQVLVFLLIVAALWWRGSSLPRRGEFVERSLPPVPRPDNLLRRAIVPTVVCAVALVVLPYDFRQATITGLVSTVLCLSFIVVTGYVGQLSVVQLALAGVAGFTVAHLGNSAGIGFPVAAVLGVVAATGLGLAIAVSALRVRGITLVVLTLAGADAIQKFVFANPEWGGGEGATKVQQPSLFGIDVGTDAGFRGLDGLLPSPVFGFFALAVVVALYMLVANLRRGDLGRRMLAVRSNERAAAASGVNVRAVKMTAFGLGSAIAGVAGVMFAYSYGTVSAGSYEIMACLALIAALYVLGITMVQGAVLAGFGATGAVLPLILQKWVFPENQIALWVQLFSALGLILQLNIFPEGVMAHMWRKRQRKAGVTTLEPATPRNEAIRPESPALLNASSPSASDGVAEAAGEVYRP
ncbi:branched-chain amino acid transport system permease protein [Frankia sp. Hr75.2]|nr:branched-chain amino acid transport system permease protein [Frankia sp. Hr75.2]